MATMARPQTAPAYSSSAFAMSGMLARPAGVAGIFAATGSSGSKFTYGVALEKATGLKEHALRRHSPYAQMTPAGWMPREPGVKPTAAMVGAGVVSAGSIDNTYVPKPLMNAWGKAREMSRNEMSKPPRKQVTDLCVVAKGGRMPAPKQSEKDMASVRSLYSKTIPLFHPIDPQRSESGFVRSPNIIPGAQPPPVTPYNATAPCKTVPADHMLRKLAYDQGMANSRMPVSRIVLAQPFRPLTAQPRFQSVSAGLPGGLSIIQKPINA